MVLIIAVLGGLGLVFVLTDPGQSQADRMSEGFGVPRDWFDVDAVNHYRRLGRGLRMLGLGLGGLLGFGVAGTFPAKPDSTITSCVRVAAPRYFDPKTASQFGTSETTAATNIVENPESSSSASVPQDLSQVQTSQAPFGPMTTLEPKLLIPPNGTQTNDARSAEVDGTSAADSGTLGQGEVCLPGEALSSSTRGQEERMRGRRVAAMFFAGLLGFVLASVLAERRAPRLVRQPEQPFVDTWQKTGRSFKWRTGAGTLMLFQLFGALQGGNAGITTAGLFVLVFIGAGLVLGGAAQRHTKRLGVGSVWAGWLGSKKIRASRRDTKVPTVRIHTPRGSGDNVGAASRFSERSFSPMYRRGLLDYVPWKAALAWLVSVIACLAVPVWVARHRLIGGTRSYFSSFTEYLLLALFGVGAQLSAVVASIVIVRFRATFSDADARALIADDARRAQAVQQLLGASVFISTSSLSLLLGREMPLGVFGWLLGGLAIFGAVLWWTPIGVAHQTAERWKALVRSGVPIQPSMFPAQNPAFVVGPKP
jgi:hypothetical protein